MTWKGTPGPWDGESGLTVRKHGRGTIATCPTPQNGGVTECCANADGIAAVPQLVEAALSVIEPLQRYNSDPHDQNLPGDFMARVPLRDLRKLLDALRAAKVLP